MLDVFISYSSKNLDFVQSLVDILEQRDKHIWFDKKKDPLGGIPNGTKWWEEIQYGISQSANFLVIVSTDSIVSPYCNAEIAFALQEEKRIVAILLREDQSKTVGLEAINTAIDDIDTFITIPKTVTADLGNLRNLARRNWLALERIEFVFAHVDDPIEHIAQQVGDAIDLDIQWHRLWSAFRQAVQLWVENEKDEGFLWSERRLEKFRENLSTRKIELDADQEEFLKPEHQRLLEEIVDINTTHKRRAFIGERLDKIGDPRDGVGLNQHLLPNIQWCFVPSGKLIIENSHTPTVDFVINEFFIAEYPITNIQFQSFIRHPDGYHCQKWSKGFPEEAIQEPLLQSRTEFYGNTPRDSLTWFQCVAFTRWLNAHKHLIDLPDKFPDYVIRLPTEWEWQLAASGGNAEYNYPWGIEWDARFANTLESGISRAIAVGMYPQGKAKCGALDLAGNIMEWCLNEFSPITSISETSNGIKACRGGTWYSGHELAKIGHRGMQLKLKHQNSNMGFRVVYGPPQIEIV